VRRAIYAETFYTHSRKSTVLFDGYQLVRDREGHDRGKRDRDALFAPDDPGREQNVLDSDRSEDADAARRLKTLLRRWERQMDAITPEPKRIEVEAATLEQLEASAGEYAEDFLRVDLEQAPAPGLADRIRELLPNALDVRIEQRGETRSTRDATALATRSPQELFAAYLEERGESNESLQALFAELLEEVHAPDPA